MHIFDVLGPVMIGPSSSHTAGAVKIGYVTRKLLGEAPVQDAAEIAAQNKRQLKAKQTSGVQQFLAKFATIFSPMTRRFRPALKRQKKPAFPFRSPGVHCGELTPTQ